MLNMHKVKFSFKLCRLLNFDYTINELASFVAGILKAATIKLIVSHDFDMVKATLPPWNKNDGPEKKTNYKFSKY